MRVFLVWLAPVVLLLMTGTIVGAIALSDVRHRDMLVFRTDVDGYDYQLYLYDMDTTLTYPVTRRFGMPHHNPEWSPDGTRIAFQSFADRQADVFYVDLDGFVLTQVTHDDEWNADPSWSPDGTQLAYTAGDAIVIHDLVTDAIVQTFTPLNHSGYIAWSPDGATIAYVDRSSIHAIDVATGDSHELISLDARLLSPEWSPDSTQIAFGATFFNEIADEVVYDIVVMDADGGNLRRLTDTPVHAISPGWSPDGARIAFWTTDATGNFDLYVMRSDGSHIRRLTHGPADDRIPQWRP